ncbi:MAG: hypothetical protein GC186_10265 [Rhodobacteraceae bacterium]|nr:hypothetical protein [Paracoccaceae bacterium]
MKVLIRRFLIAEDGAALYDWVLLGASLATLLIVAVGTATGSFATVHPAAAPADAAVSLPAPDGLGS